MKFSKTLQLATTAALLVPLAAQSCDEPAKKPDKGAHVSAGQDINVSPGWRWKQSGATKECRWQLLVEKNDNQYIELGAGKKKFGWIKIVAITDPKYKGRQQILRSNRACGSWEGQRTK